MQDTKFDQKLDERYVDAMEWLETNQYQEPHVDSLRVASLDLLQKGYDAFSTAKDQAHAQGDEYQAAALALTQADRASERSFATLTYRVQAKSFELRAASEEDYERFQAAVEQAFGGRTPTSFAGMDIDASIGVLGKAIAFCEVHFGADDADVLAAKEAHAKLDDCRRVARREESEYATAMNALIKARDVARQHYSSARDVLSGALRLVGSDHLSRIMPPLYTIYKGSSTDDDDLVDVPAEDSDDEPVEDPV